MSIVEHHDVVEREAPESSNGSQRLGPCSARAGTGHNRTSRDRALQVGTSPSDLVARRYRHQTPTPRSDPGRRGRHLVVSNPNLGSEGRHHQVDRRVRIHQCDRCAVRCPIKSAYAHGCDPHDLGAVDHHAPVAVDELADRAREPGDVSGVDPRWRCEHRNDHVGFPRFQETAKEGPAHPCCVDSVGHDFLRY